MTKYVKKHKDWFIGILLAVLIVILLALFVRQYMALGDTIEEERATYVSEIKNQLVKNIKSEKDQQTELVSIYVQVLADANPQKFEEIKSLLSVPEGGKEDDQVYLMDVHGSVYSLDKEQKSLSEQKIVSELTVNKKAVFGYTRINYNEEFWIYGAPIDPIVVDQIEICAVMNARSVKSFGERMATSILNNRGFSYIISKTGNVLLYPSVKSDMGYNLFRTLEQFGVDETDIEHVESNFLKGKDGKEILFFDDNKWLLDYSADLFDDWVVVVMMPMTITGADTYKLLNSTLMLIMLLFGSVVLLMLFIIRGFHIRERQRERVIQQEKAELVIAQGITEKKNEFLAKMSHDIRTPLNAIIGLIQITSDLVADRPKVADNLQQAGKSADYLMSILNDILDMSKIESGKMEVRENAFAMKELVDDLQAMNTMRADEKHIKFETRLEGNLAEGYLGDRVRISQIMMNLLSNAIKFTDVGGHILFGVTIEPESEDIDKVIFQVKDNGVGMSKEYMEILFQPFEQEARTQAMNNIGSGLGLSIVKNLVELMDGTIEVESEKGVGSSFVVTLSLRRTQMPEMIEEENCIQLRGKRVLLAEDNAINVMIAKKILETEGMTVQTVENGLEAVEQFEQSKDGTFDMILMDVRMPIMDGLEATMKIRSLSHPQARSIPIIALSANAFDDDIEKAVKCGMNAYLSKPVNIQQLVHTLREMMGDN